MTGRTRRTFSPEYRLEAAQLVLDQNYSVAHAARAVNVGVSTMDKWVRQLKIPFCGTWPAADGLYSEAGSKFLFGTWMMTFRDDGTATAAVRKMRVNSNTA